MNGKWEKTVYGRRWKSYEDESQENIIVVIGGLIFTVIILIFSN